VSHTLPGREEVASVEAERQIIEAVVGTAPTTCPYWSFEEPLVRDALELHAAIDSGAVSLLDPESIPARVLEARTAFHIASTRARNAQLASRREQQEAEHQQRLRAIEAARERGR